jgi:hypothetical protein
MATALPPNTYIGGFSNPNQLWFYPDGSPSTVEPSDGQVFFVWDTNKVHPKECWQYDKKMAAWLNVTANSGPTSIGHDLDLVDELDLVKEFDRMVELGRKSKKCECGSDSVGSSVHSSYCPKWSADH